MFEMTRFVFLVGLLLALGADGISGRAGIPRVSVFENPHSIKFRVCNKSVEQYQIPPGSVLPSRLASDLEETYSQREFKIAELLQASNFTSRNAAFKSQGFLSTVIEAYGGHHNLVIRPDDIWTAIMVQFSYYLNKNSEKYRHKFVVHNGTKHLEVKLGGSLRTVDYSEFVQLMNEKIDENLVDRSVKNWVLPNFSTTTADDRIAVGVVFMASLKAYFKYTFHIACGIPEITIEGTLADWKDIRKRIQKLKEFDLDWWHAKLETVLQNFINAKKGKVNWTFWNDIVYENHIGCGSTLITGWVTAFAVFDQRGDRHCGEDMITSERLNQSRRSRKANSTNASRHKTRSWFQCDQGELPLGMAMVDVKIKEDGEYDGVMFGGHLGLETSENGTTLKSVIGWLIAIKKDKPSENDDYYDSEY